VTAPETLASVLIEALPYIRRFAGKIIVVKYGGNAMVDPLLSKTFAEDIVLMRTVGMKPVVVHGGGPQIGELMDRLGLQPEFRNGLRVTDADTLDVARMVLVGKVNSEIVSSINVHGPLAIGVSGGAANLIRAKARNPELGFVGDVTVVNPMIIEKLLAEDLIPVVSTIGEDETGQAYNINADTVAAAVAEALTAEKLVYLTDVDGLLGDVDDPSTLIRRASVSQLRDLIADGTISGGMIPKVEACIASVNNGVRSVHMLNGTLPHSLLLELFTDAGIGTMITSDAHAALLARAQEAREQQRDVVPSTAQEP
jgi:acetylglutamate kinase